MPPKRKSTENDEAPPSKRPSLAADLTVAQVEKYLGAVGLKDAGKKLASESVDGGVAMSLTAADIKKMGIPAKQTKDVAKALDDLSHPLMDAFLRADKDGSFKIDVEELSHVMARAHGRPLSNEKVITLLAEVDLNDDGELDFDEFKGVLESGPNMSEDWAAVHKEISLASKIGHAVDDYFVPLQEIMRQGSMLSVSKPAAAPPRRIPSLMLRLVGFVFGMFVSAFFTIITVCVYLIYVVERINGRGQLMWQVGVRHA
mmetsp:Transcript_21253/g.54873  ORF Transcript_21253/g.54873 Transcript_21253/m.54873 type:complete len:258 (-) Transcript_21253:286-1059(-)